MEDIKVAVCVSGAFSSKRNDGSLIRNNLIQKNHFPNADFYYATWDTYKTKFEKLFPTDTCNYFSEPLMEYHPYFIKEEDHISEWYKQTANWVSKGGEKRIDWTSHHTKQILIHSWLLDSIKQEYDIIVRTRFDTFIYEEANFKEYLEDTFKNQRANCFGTTNHNKINTLTKINNDNKWSHRLMDNLIIHNVDIICTSNIDTLHNDQKLHAAEYGWYQIISMEHGSNHRNYSGWVNPDWSIPDKFYKK